MKLFAGPSYLTPIPKVLCLANYGGYNTGSDYLFSSLAGGTSTALA
jgi:hypothetical protein